MQPTVTLYDITVPIRSRMPVYPGDPAPRLSQVKSLDRGDAANISHFAGGMHTGTHVDAPRHFFADGLAVDALPLDVMVGPATVIALETKEHITAEHIAVSLASRAPERLLLKTGNSAFWSDDAFRSDFIALTPEAAEWLVDHGVRLVGIDYLSIEPYPSEQFPVHYMLLGAGVVVIEGLDLRGVPTGDYNLTCLPLRLSGAEAAPARVILTTMT